jgi:hypothetical protein
MNVYSAARVNEMVSTLFLKRLKRSKTRRVEERMRWRVCTKYESRGEERLPSGRIADDAGGKRVIVGTTWRPKEFGSKDYKQHDREKSLALQP